MALETTSISKNRRMELHTDDTRALGDDGTALPVEQEDQNFDSNVWDGGPPIPPDPDVVINDLSCQGTVAMALHEALEELQQHDTIKALKEQYQFQLNSQDVMRVFGESIAHQQHVQYDAQFDEALKHQQQQQQVRGKNNKYSNKSSRSNINHTDIDAKSKVPPAAMLRGRIHHYNRFGTKWRIVVEDAEIVPRRTIDPHQLRQMKRDRTMSLWSIMSSQPQAATEELPIKIPRLEILVYNDIE